MKSRHTAGCIGSPESVQRNTLTVVLLCGLMLGTAWRTVDAQTGALRQVAGSAGSDTVLVEGYIDESGDLIVEQLPPLTGVQQPVIPPPVPADPGIESFDVRPFMAAPATTGHSDYVTLELPEQMLNSGGVTAGPDGSVVVDVLLDDNFVGATSGQVFLTPYREPAGVQNGYGSGLYELIVQEEGPPVPQPGGGSAAASNQNAAGSRSSGSESYGQQPVDTSYAFLRRVSPLLSKGDCQFDCGLVYSLFENDLPFLIDPAMGPDFVEEGRLRSRLLTVPFAIRYGIADDTQLFINVPVGWNHNELSLPGFDIFSEEGGIGDITVGMTYLLNRPCPGEPDVIGTAALTIPTGNPNLASVVQQPGAQLGGGHFAIAANLLCIHSVDPLVVFYGAGFRSQFPNKFSNSTIDVQPGIEANYRFGVGFAVNNKVTLSTALLGSYITDARINGFRLPHSSLEPIVMRFAATMAGGDRIQEPFVEVGLTDDSSAATLGWVVTY